MAMAREHRWTIEVSFWDDETVCADIWQVETANPDGSAIAALVETCNETTLTGALTACARFIRRHEKPYRRPDPPAEGASP